MKKQLVVCGGGSSSHTLIPLLSESNFDVSVYTSRPEKWSNTIELEWHDPSGKVMSTYSGSIKKASNNPKELFSNADYEKIRVTIMKMYPEKDYRYMLDYLALERFSYQSENSDIKESFTMSQTLVSIQTPTIQNEEGLWEVDRNHRFFMDNIYYGNCIAKWMAEQLNIEVPTIDAIIIWAQNIRNEQILDSNNCLILDSKDLSAPMKTGIPYYYGYKTIEDIID